MTIRWLEDVAQGRDNNFNLIRIVAATAVLVSHAWPITLGDGVPEPLKTTTGFTLGTLAVYAFFVISGFLITASFERSRTLTRFVLARVLRLVPGLAVSLLLVAFCLGPLVTSLSGAAYFAHPDTYSFLWRNMALAVPQYTLPGVFQDQPVAAVEGSIWTLFYEVACYVGVLVAGLAGLLGGPVRFALALGGYAAVQIAVARFDPALPYQAGLLLDLSLPFVLGMALWVWRARIPMSLTLALVLCGLAWLAVGTPVYTLALNVALGYGLFWLAYVPGGAIRAYNRLGDYSYGLYIYAFPVQGLTVWLFGVTDPWVHVALALPLTLVPSVLSWHLIEAPALTLLRRVGRVSRLTAAVDRSTSP